MNFRPASQQLLSLGVVRFIIGIVAFFIGVIAKHPLLALAILACAVVVPAWKHWQAMRLQREQNKANLIAEATALARQRQNQRLNTTSPPPLEQTLPPPMPASATPIAPNQADTPFEFDVPVAPLPQAATAPTLDWQPARGFTPPSVMPKSTAFAPPYGASMSSDPDFADAELPRSVGAETLKPGESDYASNFDRAAENLSAPEGFQRVDLGGRDGYQLVKVVHSNNPSEVLRFELLRGLEVICSGTQAQVKAALQAVLRAP
jgi:hypothetical protein